MVPADSDRIPRAPPYSGVTLTDHALPVRGCHPLRRSFPNSFRFLTTFLWPVLQPRRVLEHDGLGSSLFARHYWGNRLFLSFPPGTKMFQFPGFAPSLRWYWIFNPVGCPIRIRPDQFVFANPRPFSQLTASFVACRSQGILHSPLLLFSRESTFL